MNADGTRVIGQILRHLRDSTPLSPSAAAAAAAAAAARDSQSAGDDVDPLMMDELSRVIEAKMAEYRTTGVAFGIFKDGSSACRAFGITDVDNPQPVTTDTVFPIASISKTVCGTAIMRLHDQGKLNVEGRVQDYLPDFALADANAARDLKIWHLLTHTPGFEGQLDTPDRGSETSAHFVETLRYLPQLARPGQVWSYNNAGWGVAGRVVEAVTGKTIGEALSELVFEPLRLDRACSSTAVATSWRFAQPHTEANGQTAVIRPFSLPASVAAGGCAMSVENLLVYARFHLAGTGVTADGAEQLLSSSSLLSMREARIRKNSSEDKMGLGWHLRELGAAKVLTAQHGGSLAGHCLHIQLVPERNLCFCILTNHSDGWRLNEELGSFILKEVEGLSLAPGQRTGGNRGGNERMSEHSKPLEVQPDLNEYVGTYARPPVGEFVITQEQVGGDQAGLVVAASSRPGSWGMEHGFKLAFYAEDCAYSTGPGAYVGTPVEFIRDEDGVVMWVRVNGRIARKRHTR